MLTIRAGRIVCKNFEIVSNAVAVLANYAQVVCGVLDIQLATLWLHHVCELNFM